MSTWLTAAFPFTGLGIVAAVVALRTRHRNRHRVPGLETDGEPLRPAEAILLAVLEYQYHSGAAPEPEYGKRWRKA